MLRTKIFFSLILAFSICFDGNALTLENNNYRVVIAEDWIDSHPPGSLVEFSSFSEPIGDILDR
ncbi:hypothetical protein KKA08_03455, partial [bacterium]|nr:hypothetical protein [bacterium]